MCNGAIRVGEILDGETEFCCPECYHMTTLSQEYDLDMLSKLTISCPDCHNSFGAIDPDEELSRYYVRWNGHEIGKYSETFACRNCKLTGEPIIEHGEAEEWQIFLYVLANLKNYPCIKDPEKNGFVERVTERLK